MGQEPSNGTFIAQKGDAADTYDLWPEPDTQSYAALAARFRPLFARIAEDAVKRDRERQLVGDAIAELRAAGYTALVVPVDEGGLGASAGELLALQTELAAADSNITQALRAHFGQSLALLRLPKKSPWRWRWNKVIADGGIFASGFSETGSATVGTFATRIRQEGDGFRVDGRKFYTTGGLYADWIATAVTDDEGKTLQANIATAADGVRILDDWNGFGQQLTASGTTLFEEVFVPASDIPGEQEPRWPLVLAYAQISHIATLAGIGRAAAEAASSYTRTRTRVFSHGSGKTAASDPLVQQKLGSVFAGVYSANVLAARVSQELERNIASLENGRSADPKKVARLDIEVYQAQIIVQNQVLSAVSELFDALGASALSKELGYDRFWRNARAISSHNPLIYKERLVGDYAINRVFPPGAWTAGSS